MNDIDAAFSYLDKTGSPTCAAEVSMRLANNQYITVRAGGSGVRSWPALPPYTGYEVLLDHDPARFWHKYSDDSELIYANVPRLLVTHHIIRHGGAADIVCEVNKPVNKLLQIQIMASNEAEKAIWLAIKAMKDVSMVSSKFIG